MNIIDIISKIDIELLKEQSQSIENAIDVFDSEIQLLSDEDTDMIAALEKDRENLEGLLELIDNLVCSLEDM